MRVLGLCPSPPIRGTHPSYSLQSWDFSENHMLNATVDIFRPWHWAAVSFSRTWCNPEEPFKGPHWTDSVGAEQTWVLHEAQLGLVAPVGR